MPKKTTTKIEEEIGEQAGRYASKLTWGTIGITVLVVTTVYLFWTANISSTWLRGIVMTGVLMVPAFAFWRTFWPRASRGKDLAFLGLTCIVAVAMMQPLVQNVWKEYVFTVTQFGLVTASGTVAIGSFVLIVILCLALIVAIWRTKPLGRAGI